VTTIASDRFSQLLAFAFALGLLVIGEGFAVAEEPLRRDVVAEPDWRNLRQGIQGSVEGLADNFQIPPDLVVKSQAVDIVEII
jgi:hypothetical protein